jgi:hypothetical protein
MLLIQDSGVLKDFDYSANNYNINRVKNFSFDKYND